MRKLIEVTLAEGNTSCNWCLQYVYWCARAPCMGVCP